MKIEDITILVVDDEPALREIFSGWLLSLHRGEVLMAGDGEEAFGVLLSRPVALLVTDIRMPRMEGTALVRRLAEHTRIPSIIFVSAFSDVDERMMYDLGVEAFLTKPILKENLVRVVNRALARRSDLWSQGPSEWSRQTIVIDQAGESKPAFALGRGGFCARCQTPVALGKVNYQCHLDGDDTTIQGSGIVRWRSRSEGLIGVEFCHMDDESRAYIVRELESKRPVSFIPATPGV